MNKTGPGTIKVAGNPVAPATALLPTDSAEAQIRRSMQRSLPHEVLESWSRDMAPLIRRGAEEYEAGKILNPLFDAVLLAFYDHRPLVLSPDMVWLAIAQGFASHVNLHAEEMRARFVDFDGKKTITVQRDDFVKGNPDNDWESLFSTFSDAIAQIVGQEKRELLVQSFSTTGAVERAAMEVTLMDAMQSYFDYTVVSLCGIPGFQLEGEVADWQKLRDAAEYLGEYGMDWWMPALLPMLDEFVAASNGQSSSNFWQDFVNVGGGSGGPYYSGNVLRLFPYIFDGHRKLVRNEAMPVGRKARGDSKPRRLSSVDMPCGLSIAPFTWKYHGQDFKMEFVAGFVGIEQDEVTLALRPKIGWAIRDADQNPVLRT